MGADDELGPAASDDTATGVPTIAVVPKGATGKAAAKTEADADEESSAPRITVTGGQRGPVKTARVEWLSGPFEGTWMKSQVNPRRKVFGEIASGDDERQDKAVAGIILDHNFTDVETSEPLPTPMTAEGLGLLPMDQYAAVIQAAVKAIQRGSALPKSD